MNQPLPQRVVTTLAKRVYRMHLFLFDELRSYWLGYAEKARKDIAALGWEPPRPASEADGKEIIGNGSGEDYLYLHCELLSFVNYLLADIGDPTYPRVEGWERIPPPDDPDYPVPPAWFFPEGLAVSNAFIARSKTDDFFERRFKYWERTCTNPNWLRRVTLDELGTTIESTLHDGLRSRWAAPPAAWRPDPPVPGEPIADGFDDPRYDFLRDTYAMHVNPIYWRFYGWVQDRVEDWKVANGVFGRDFWKNTWIGKMPEGHEPKGRCPVTLRDVPVFAAFDDPEIATRHLAEMEQVVSIIAGAEEKEA